MGLEKAAIDEQAPTRFDAALPRLRRRAVRDDAQLELTFRAFSGFVLDRHY